MRIVTPATDGQKQALIAWLNTRMPWPMAFGGAHAIGISRGPTLLACAVYYDYRRLPFGASMDCAFAAVPGSRWASKGTLRAIFDYPFRQLGVTRLIATTSADNDSAKAMLTSMGFVREGIARKGYDGRMDAEHWALLREDCKWLLAVPRAELAAA